jgi:hydrogenase nickel incorporation protein HypB
MCITCGCGQQNKTEKQSDNETRMIALEESVLRENDHYAQANKRLLGEKNILAMNVLASPGAGKTTLLSKTGESVSQECSVEVIVGDQQTDNDANHFKRHGLVARQITTNKVCHLDAHMVGHALETLTLAPSGLLIIENIGNLVCPALFYLGEDYRVVLLSVTEGEDKPLKYPHMFESADVIVLTKIDLLPHLTFDLDGCLANIKKINPKAVVFQLSSSSGEGMAAWLQWVEKAILGKQSTD